MINGKYIIVPTAFMEDLGLDGKELLTYCVIYSFSQDGHSYYYGSWQYLCQMTYSSRTTVYNSLNSLVRKGLIAKEDFMENGVKRCRYYATSTRDTKENTEKEEYNISSNAEKTPVQNLNHPRSKTELPPVQNLNPYYYNKKNKKEREKDSAPPQTPTPSSQDLNPSPTPKAEAKPKAKKSESLGFKEPSLEEVEHYIEEEHLEMTEEEAQDFYDHNQSIGWVVGKSNIPMKDWRPALRKWSRRQKKWNAEASRSKPTEQDYTYNDNIDYEYVPADRIF
jgi:DNA-binding PadR family transcriptional regulator